MLPHDNGSYVHRFFIISFFSPFLSSVLSLGLVGLSRKGTTLITFKGAITHICRIDDTQLSNLIRASPQFLIVTKVFYYDWLGAILILAYYD